MKRIVLAAVLVATFATPAAAETVAIGTVDCGLTGDAPSVSVGGYPPNADYEWSGHITVATDCPFLFGDDA